MRSSLFVCVVLLCALGLACIQEHPHSTAEMKIDRGPVRAGEEVNIMFQVRNPEGQPTGDLEIIHEKPMHLFMVSRDLSQYFHEHPEKQKDGTFKLPFRFPNGGRFKVFIDFKVREQEQVVESFDIEVSGDVPEPVELEPETEFESTIGGVKVTMDPGGEIKKHTDTYLEFQVSDAEDGKPVDDLEMYLGEKAHFVIVRKGLGRFIHAHPMSSMMKKLDSMKGMDMEKNKAVMKKLMAKPDRESRVIAMANFPNSGVYKIFAQFKRNGEIITVPFVFRVG